MANWSGSFSITAGATGTSTGGNTTTTFWNTGATWPTGAQSLANFTVRILTGTGAGQERVISSNTATQLTVPTWTTTPDATSTYEIVLILKNSDHITGSLTLTTNVISELEDSAIIYVDGNYTITLTTSSVIRWDKSESTLVTFEANNRTVQGKAAFWSYITVATGKTTSAAEISYIKVMDATYGIVAAPSAIMGDMTKIHHIWAEDISASVVHITGAALTENTYHSNFFCRLSQGGAVTANNVASTYTQTFEKIWTEHTTAGGVAWGGATTAPNLTWAKNCVFLKANSNRNVDVGTGKEYRASHIYQDQTTSGAILMGATSTAATGTYRAFHNCSRAGRMLYAANIAGSATLISDSNDIAAKGICNVRGIDIQGAASYASATSNKDYLAGNTYAAYENVDTTLSTSSTASPSQYRNLTATRTNAKSTPNFPLEADNVVEGTPTSNSVTITFDCANGADSGQSTTVNVDSASGQPVLNVASSAPFMVGMTLEIGYGTARQETLEVASVGAGTITFTTNLAFTHTAAQADTVKPDLRFWGLPFVEYGTASGVYTIRSMVPDSENWGLIFTGLKSTYDGVQYEWKKTGHSVTLSGLEPDTTYYYKAGFYNPFGEDGDSAEGTFTTASTANYSDPGEANVRLGTTYKYGSPTPNKTGTARIPSAGNVKIGYAYDSSDSVTGTYDGSDRWTDPGESNVRLSTAYKANSTSNNKTGNARIPSAGNVKIGYAYDSLDGTTGTYDGSERYTDLNQATVLAGITSRYNTTGADNRMGTLVSPTVAEIWSENLSSYNTIGTAGYIGKMVYAFTKFTNLFSKSKI